MKRLVYSPKVYAYIKSDSGVVDVTDYIVNARVTRRLNAISSAELTLRNPQFRFTKQLDANNAVMPVFHPMDPISIIMERLAGFPVQVFTGYLDETPYLSLYPGTVDLKASCTLKRLAYTYFNPNLFATAKFLMSNGWTPGPSDGTALSKYDALFGVDPKNIPLDGSFSHLLERTLKEIGGWDPNTFHILPIPDSIIPIISKLFTLVVKDQKEVNNEFQQFISKLLGPGNIVLNGTGSGSGGTGTGTVGSGPNPPTVVTGVSPPRGGAWRVQASQESTDLGQNSGGGCGSHQTSASLNGWSELQNCRSLGGTPCDLQLYIQANGRVVKAGRVDCGGGSSFNPVIGIYPAVAQLLGLTGGQYTVTIWRVDGQPLNVASGGTRV